MYQITEKFLIDNNINLKKNIIQRTLLKEKSKLAKELNVIIKVNLNNINLFISEKDLINFIQYFKDYKK